MNPIAIRLLNQQLINKKLSSPHDIVSHFGIIQAQDYQMMRKSVLLRMVKPDIALFEKDFNTGKILRMHLFRSTWQLVAREDVYNWLFLCRKSNINAVKSYMKSRGYSFHDNEYPKALDIWQKILADGQCMTFDMLNDELKKANIICDKHVAKSFLIRAEFDGILCNGDLTSKSNTFTLLSNKVPDKPYQILKDEILPVLADKYFMSHSPATFKDFVWWTGLTATECRYAIESIKHNLQSIKIKNEEYFVHDRCTLRGFRKGNYILLPAYDEYLIGYKSRHITIDEQYQKFAYNNFGIFYPIILFDGKGVGNWKQKGTKIDFSFFDKTHVINETSLSKLII